MPLSQLSQTDQLLLNNFQHGFPLQERPFAEIARQLNVSEDYVIASLQRLQAQGIISRVGPVFYPNRIGNSTLAAMAVPEDRLDEVAEMVSAYDEVNHNYQREHEYNLWFVVTAENRQAIDRLLDDIAQRSGLDVLDLPMQEDYYIDLGFKLQWT